MIPIIRSRIGSGVGTLGIGKGSIADTCFLLPLIGLAITPDISHPTCVPFNKTT